MYLIHDYHLYFSSAGAQADVHSLYYVIRYHHHDVSLPKLFIEKGESKYSTDSNEMFVLSGFMLNAGRVVGVFAKCVFVCVCVCVRACVRACVHVCTYIRSAFV